MGRARETRRDKRIKGFTLVELLVVLAILGMLAALVGPQVLNQLGGAKSKSAAIQISDLEQALELYKLDVGKFPSSEQGLDALVRQPSGAMVAETVAALMAQIEDGETEPRRVKIDGPLVVRRSARRPTDWKTNWKGCDDERL